MICRTEPVIRSEPLELVWTRWLSARWGRKWWRKRSLLFFSPTFDVIFILLADYGKNPSRRLKKMLAMAKISRSRRCSASSPTLKVCGPLLSPHTLSPNLPQPSLLLHLFMTCTSAAPKCSFHNSYILYCSNWKHYYICLHRSALF